MSKIEIGKKAPQFTLEGTGGKLVAEDARARAW
jgi:peroxiredoxin